jgi:hypothetical protein
MAELVEEKRKEGQEHDYQQMFDMQDWHEMRS